MTTCYFNVLKFMFNVSNFEIKAEVFESVLCCITELNNWSFGLFKNHIFSLSNTFNAVVAVQ